LKWWGADDIWRALGELGNPLKIKKREIPVLIKYLCNCCYLDLSFYWRGSKYRPSNCIGTRLPPPSTLGIEVEVEYRPETGDAVLHAIPERRSYPMRGGTFVEMTAAKYDD